MNDPYLATACGTTRTPNKSYPDFNLILSWNWKGPTSMSCIFIKGKYKITAFLSHSLTCQIPFTGSAILRRPMSRSSTTVLMARITSFSFSLALSTQAFYISFSKSINSNIIIFFQCSFFHFFSASVVLFLDVSVLLLICFFFVLLFFLCFLSCSFCSFLKKSWRFESYHYHHNSHIHCFLK